MLAPDFALTLEHRTGGNTVLVVAGELDLYRAPEIEGARAGRDVGEGDMTSTYETPRNRAMVRALNRHLPSRPDDNSADETLASFTCECPAESCFADVTTTVTEWEAATSEADYYVAHPEHVAAEDQAVAATRRYAVACSAWRGGWAEGQLKAGTSERQPGRGGA